MNKYVKMKKLQKKKKGKNCRIQIFKGRKKGTINSYTSIERIRGREEEKKIAIDDKVWRITNWNEGQSRELEEKKIIKKIVIKKENGGIAKNKKEIINKSKERRVDEKKIDLGEMEIIKIIRGSKKVKIICKKTSFST